MSDEILRAPGIKFVPMGTVVAPKEPDNVKKENEVLRAPGIKFVPMGAFSTGTEEDPLRAPGVKFDPVDVGPKNPSEIPKEIGTETRDKIVADNAILQLQDIIKEYDRSLTKEDFLEDDRLMSLIRANMEARYKTGESSLGTRATALAGGATSGRWAEMDDEELFETWQNYHRSFAGGQTVTTANEVAFVTSADERTKALLGMGYELFDSMGNIFSGDTSWSEMFDGIGDYMTAAVWDPVTVASLGVGKAFATGGTKAAAIGLKEVGRQAYRQAIKKGMKDVAAKQAASAAIAQGRKQIAKNVAKTGVQYFGVDLASNVGADIAYQNVLIDTGAQEDFSYLQTGIAALGTVALPGLVITGKGLSKGAQNLMGKTGSLEDKIIAAYASSSPADIKKALAKAVKEKVQIKVSSDASAAFSDPARVKPWRQAVKEAKKEFPNQELGEDTNLFWRTFLLGDKKLQVNGLAKALEESNISWVPIDKDDKFSRFLGDVIASLDDETVGTFVRGFESALGREMNFMVKGKGVDKYTAKGLAKIFTARSSQLGTGLNQLSIASSVVQKRPIFKKAKDVVFGASKDAKTPSFKEFADAVLDETGAAKTVEPTPQWGGWLQSVWKRLLTSTASTTGANVRGFALLYANNTASDMVEGVIHYGIGTLKAGATKVYGADLSQSAAESFNLGKASILGSLRRGATLLDPDATLKEADAYLISKPEVQKELFRLISGDAGVGDAASVFNIKPDSVVGKVGEGLSNGAQTLAGVKLQDELTKKFAFMNALDLGVRREYGVSFEDFISGVTPDGKGRSSSEILMEMNSPKWKNNVDGFAVERTIRETASKSWKPDSSGANFVRQAAGFVEDFSSGSVTGYLMPFGRFFNTTIATIADGSGVNLVWHTAKRLSGADINPVEEQFTTLMARAAVGWGAFYLYSLEGEKNIEEGLAYNQSRREDGSIADRTFDWPESVLRVVGQMWAHKRRDGEVPADLIDEGLKVLGAQPFRDLDAAGRSIYTMAKDIVNMPEGGTTSYLMDGLGSSLARVASGATRPLDPINQLAMVYQGDTVTPDRRQGIKAYNEATKYFDHIFGDLSQDLPDRRFATKREARADIGKQFGGVRSTPEPTPIELMLNSIGKSTWNAVKWDGPPELKNRLDDIIEPILNAEASAYLMQNPDFNDKTLAKRQEAVDDIIKFTKKVASDAFEASFDEEDQDLQLVKKAAGLNKTDLRRAAEYLSLPIDPADVLAEPEGRTMLELLIFTAENWKDVGPEYRD